MQIVGKPEKPKSRKPHSTIHRLTGLYVFDTIKTD